jgi:hypothetical protein
MSYAATLIEGATPGQRLAGGLLLGNAALVFLEVALLPSGLPQAVASMLGRLDDYADAVANNLKLRLRGTIESREPLDENPVFGRILHAKATVSGIPVEYYFGVFARGAATRLARLLCQGWGSDEGRSPIRRHEAP